MHAALAEFHSIFLWLKRYFPWGRKWITFYGWQGWNPMLMFGVNLIRCNQTKQHWWKSCWSSPFFFFFEAPAVTGDTVLAMMENCFVSCYGGNSFPVRWCTTSFLLLCSCLFWQGVTWWLDRKRGPIPCPPPKWFIWMFSSGGFQRHCLFWKSVKCKGVVWQSSELQSALPMTCLPISGNKLGIIFVCVVPLVMPIFRSAADHMRKFMRSSVWKCINFFSTLIGQR